MKTRSVVKIAALFFVLGITTVAGAVPAQDKAAPPAAAAGDVATETVETLLASVNKSGERIAELRKGVSLASGERRELLLPELSEVTLQYRRELNQAAARLTGSNALPGSNEQRAAAVKQIKATLASEGDLIRGELENELEKLTSLVTRVENAPQDQRAELEQTRNASAKATPIRLEELDSNFEARALLGEDVSAQRKKLATLLERGSKLVSGTLHSISANLDKLAETTGVEPKPEEQAKRTAIEDFRSLVVDLQRKTIALMDKYGLDTVQHRQDLISTTGQVTKDILDAEVASGLAKKWKDDAVAWVSERASVVAFNAVTFLVIALAFLGLARIGRWLAQRTFGRSKHMSSLASDFFVTFVSRAILLVGVVIAAAQVGIQVAPLLAGLGIAGFVLGFALQDSLSNFASGMMILMYRPFDVGDMIEAAGVLGTVKNMNLVSTSVLTPDNQMLIVPNSKIWGGVIRNVTHQPIRRVDLSFGIGYGEDGARAQAVLEALVNENPKVLKEPAPVVRLHELTGSSANFVVRPWVKTEDYWEVYWGITEAVKHRFDAAELPMPHQRRNVHLFEEHVSERRRTSDVVPASHTNKTG